MNKRDQFLETWRDLKFIPGTDNSVQSLTTMYQTATKAVSSNLVIVEAWKQRSRFVFRVTVPMPPWVELHLSQFTEGEVQREQEEFEARAAARKTATLYKP